MEVVADEAGVEVDENSSNEPKVGGTILFRELSIADDEEGNAVVEGAPADGARPPPFPWVLDRRADWDPTSDAVVAERESPIRGGTTGAVDCRDRPARIHGSGARVQE